ncbi:MULTISPECIES: TRAP transporter small permease [Ruegeria]|uniref:TRAP transporter small permease protein n=1 Tax=Ruegeria atlantica TaxID=81569 RepID=A0A0P1EU76_9RHOB|nr:MULTISPECIES: TRAP transporter small permease subunit [Ruegeria]CUH46987.1 2,3-diketo-L-gulonate TRAP transporter small permease protein YiaM [Ruegeria atlantica]
MANIQKPRLRNPWYVVLHLPTWIAAGTLFMLMCMTFLDVVLRSAFDNPIESATELTRLFMAIIVFSALPLVSWKGENIVVDLLDPFFSERLAQMRDSLIDAICGIVLIWPAIRVWELAERARQYGDVTEYLNLPQFYVGWFISIFVALTAIAFLARSVVRQIANTEVSE